jgi:hypothetical protein
MTQAMVFVSTCPSCKREQPQDAFTVAHLLGLLDGGFPIEAYCVSCEQFWSISARERIELGEAVAVVCPARRQSSESDCRTQRPREDAH